MGLFGEEPWLIGRLVRMFVWCFCKQLCNWHWDRFAQGRILGCGSRSQSWGDDDHWGDWWRSKRKSHKPISSRNSTDWANDLILERHRGPKCKGDELLAVILLLSALLSLSVKGVRTLSSTSILFQRHGERKLQGLQISIFQFLGTKKPLSYVWGTW